MIEGGRELCRIVYLAAIACHSVTRWNRMYHSFKAPLLVSEMDDTISRHEIEVI